MKSIKNEEMPEIEIIVSKEDQKRFVSKYGAVMDMVMRSIDLMVAEHDLKCLNCLGGFLFALLEGAKVEIQREKKH